MNELGEGPGGLEEYRAHLPMTARQIFYRLVGAYAYPKDEAGYGRLIEMLNRARRARMIPMESIRDDRAEPMAAPAATGTRTSSGPGCASRPAGTAGPWTRASPGPWRSGWRPRA